MAYEEPLPARIDRYEPLKRLAVGGMAELFLAKQSGLEGFEKVVVLKRILPNLAVDEEFTSMFLDEARIAAKLSHPNVVQIYDLGKADSTYYIAMEYVSGRNVQHLINKQQQYGGHLPVEHVCKIIAGVCDGLYYAHARKDYDGKPLNIIHRDISPQNILVSFAGGVKVVDFGIAKASTQLAQTRAGVLKGKYAYMSPEQVRGAKIDHRSDIFALGLVMYEMLTGVRAFERDNSLKTLKAIVQEKPLNPREMNPDIPMDVVKLLSKALEKNPDRRYKTAQEMQLALEDWLESSPKKSNNVRLSRFLYDLFDDELNSAEGTMVVKGVGQVIIPTSQGKEAVPAIEEEVDSKTLSAALVDSPAEPVAPSTRVRDELAAKQKQAQALKAKTPPPADDFDDDMDDKTLPGVDIEQVERDALARQQARAAATAAKAGQTMESESEEDEDKTRAGVPLSQPSMPMQAALREPSRDSGRRPMAPPPQAQPQPPQAQPSRYEEEDDDVELATHENQRPTLPTSQQHSDQQQYDQRQPYGDQQPNHSQDYGGQDYGGMNQPEPQPYQDYPPSYDTQGTDTPDNLQAPIVVAQPAKKPGSFIALIAASGAMAFFAIVLFGVGAIAFPGAVDPVSYGVVVVKTDPPGAIVAFDSTRVTTPAQFVVPLSTEPRKITVALSGYRPMIPDIAFEPGRDHVVIDLKLEPAQ